MTNNRVKSFDSGAVSNPRYIYILFTSFPLWEPKSPLKSKFPFLEFSERWTSAILCLLVIWCHLAPLEAVFADRGEVIGVPAFPPSLAKSQSSDLRPSSIPSQSRHHRRPYHYQRQSKTTNCLGLWDILAIFNQSTIKKSTIKKISYTKSVHYFQEEL